jgi:uncharacterized protein
MKFAAVIEYITDTAKVGEIRPAHRQYLQTLLERGQLACAGPFMDDFGALIVYEAASAEEAEGFLKADPFHTGGVFVRWTIRPWKTVFVPAGGMQVS